MTYAFQAITTRRHNRFISEIYLALSDLLKLRKYEAMHEEQALVYEGNLYDVCSLVDIRNMQPKTQAEYRKSIIDLLPFVQPDFMLFDKAGFLLNESETKVAGLPRLVVEIWSPSNREEERMLQKKLYSSREAVEHWYIAQDSNHVEAFIGAAKLPDKDLRGVMSTEFGVSLDLTYLAL